MYSSTTQRHELLRELAMRADRLIPHSGNDYREEATYIAWPTSGVLAQFCQISWSYTSAGDPIVIVGQSVEELASEAQRVASLAATLGGRLTILRGEQVAWLRRGSQFTSSTPLTELEEAVQQLEALHRTIETSSRT